MDDNDRTRLLDMADMAHIVSDMIKGQSRASLDDSMMLKLALQRAIEVIGEAANKVSAQVREQTPEIPWKDIVGMRNRPIHGYRDVNLDALWDTATTSIPILITELDKLLSDD